MKRATKLRAVLVLATFLLAVPGIAHNDSTTAYLGVWYQHISEDKAEFMKIPAANTNGILVEGVTPGSPAERSGLKFMDYIFEMNGVLVSDEANWHDLFDELNPGESVSMKVIRNREPLSLRATLTSRAELIDEDYDKGAFLGVQITHYDYTDRVVGARVDVIGGTTAEMIGLEDGDVITAINGYELYDWHDLGIVMDNLDPGTELCVTYLREGETNRSCTTAVTRDDEPIESEPDSLILANANANANSNTDAEEIVLRPSIPTPVEGREIVTEEGYLKLFEDEVSSIAVADMEDDEIEMMEEEYEMDMPERGIPYRDLNLYPNPSDGRFTFFIDLSERADAELRITDAQGRTVYVESIPNAEGRIERRLDISGRAKGVYFLIVLQNDRSITKRVIVD